MLRTIQRFGTGVLLGAIALGALPLTLRGEEPAGKAAAPTIPAPPEPAEAAKPAPQTMAVPQRLAEIFAGEAPEGLEDLKAMEEHFRTLVKRVTPCTVGVRIGAAQGSGVIISPDGYVLTAAHVIGKPGRNVVVVLPDGKTTQGKSLGLNRAIDSGLIKIDGDRQDWPYVEMSDSKELKLGQWCAATGHPGGYQRGRLPVLRVGRVLANRPTVLVTDCTLVGGDSGGPLWDMEGKVIGIHSRIGGAITSNMHVPVNTYRETWERLADGEEFGGSRNGQSPYIGVIGEPDATNAKIGEVAEGSPAEEAGIQPGDVIVAFNGKAVQDFRALAVLVRETAPGDQVKVKVDRDGKLLEFDLTIGQRE